MEIYHEENNSFRRSSILNTVITLACLASGPTVLQVDSEGLVKSLSMIYRKTTVSEYLDNITDVARKFSGTYIVTGGEIKE